ncbi:MAG TPA: multicopper oxidase domain-containing protein, partial [Bauldia sp.]|nr:multicopper oxidase domain-containing protein [Bauldia sp.]
MNNWLQILVAVVLVGGVLGLSTLGNETGQLAYDPDVVTPASQDVVAAPTSLDTVTAASPETGTDEVRTPTPQQSSPKPPAATAESEPHRSAEIAATSADRAAETGAGPGSADLEAGMQVYRKCQACHALEPGKNRLGPTLAGVMGRKAGAVEGFAYSQAMLDSGLVWDEATLDAYLKDPQHVVPGNRMPFPGLKTDNQRREVIAYLASASTDGAIPEADEVEPPVTKPARPSVQYLPDVRYTLRTEAEGEGSVFVGVGGAIDGEKNPALQAVEGQVVQITLINGDGREHDIVFPDQDTRSPRVFEEGSGTSIAFRVTTAGDFTYHSSLPGQREAGMSGRLVVAPQPPAESVVQADLSRNPADLPPPEGPREPQTVRLDLVTVEQEARLADGTTYIFWTFNGRVPGPFIRVRVGDTIEVHVKNADDSSMIHSVDFHAATGPGGGAASLQVDPGQEKSMRWKALTPGLYVYHCATPMVAHHIASGMYGLILVEPEGGLPPV